MCARTVFAFVLTAVIVLAPGVHGRASEQQYMIDKGLTSMMEKKFKMGAEAWVAMRPVAGTGVRGATTANLDADIYTSAVTSGVFGGISFDGTMVVERDVWNENYCGAVVTARQIVIEHRISNKRADRQRRAMAGKAGK